MANLLYLPRSLNHRDHGVMNNFKRLGFSLSALPTRGRPRFRDLSLVIHVSDDLGRFATYVRGSRILEAILKRLQPFKKASSPHFYLFIFHFLRFKTPVLLA